MKVFLKTFGCKVNAAETDSIAVLLVQNGWEITEIPEQADVLLVNSCTVTASGDKRMMQAIRKLRKSAPDAVLLLTGCYVQAFPEDASAIPEADIITGTKNRLQIPALLESYFQNPHRISAVEQFVSGDSFESLPQGSDAGHTRAFLKIQDGCNRFCSYCIIPYARGRCRSRNPEEIQKEAEILVRKGYREIVLCGINLACYAYEKYDIADAVRLTAESGISQVRLGSLEPDGLTPEVLKKLSRIPALCPHFHISVQSGCDKTLKQMHRHYTCTEYAELIGQIRKLFPRCAVTTDIMTGFPNESEEDFAQTMEFVKEIRFSEIHIFRYSPRSGTPASKWPEQIPEKIKKERADRLAELAGTLREEYLKSCIGEMHRVLFERQKSPEWHNGHAENYALVRVPAQEGENFRNQIFSVRITGVQDGGLTGEIIHID